MRLIVTEKLSVAASICSAIGVREEHKHDGYIEGDGIIATWCLGHLVEMAPPESYGEQYRKWSYGDLPIIPDRWKYQIKQATKKQFSTVKRLMNRHDVTEVICGTDAGREGELIFRLVYNEAGCRKPYKRLWISSMEEAAIRHGMDNLKPGSDYDSLYEAALCRAKADWLIGMNGTRLFSVLYKGKVKKVGRVQTPTLAMIVDRDAEIAGFRKSRYYVVEIEAAGIRIRSERHATREEAEVLLAGFKGHEIRVKSVMVKEAKASPPQLFDLTSLQREANRMFGFTAKQTLDCLQSLYEKKLATYPRTDSRYLTDDMGSSMGNLLSIVKGRTGMGDEKPEINRVLNSLKVSDHHAVIITPEVARTSTDEIPDSEKKVLGLIMLRMAEATAKESVVIRTEAELECSGSVFKITYDEPKQMGFKAYTEQFRLEHGIKKTGTPSPDRKLKMGDIIPPDEWKGEVKEDATRPAQHFTESTLLASMEKAGADETSKDAERRGLGTPATRADIIEKLIHDGYVKRVGKRLEATDEGNRLITVLPDRIKSPSYTAEWENRLAEIAKGEGSPHVFMECIETEVRQMVGAYSSVGGDQKR
ncbi:MAG: DNA topoisomerase III [Lachnospiraceae bacterium]|nr:DNA topoisomerase III [Lachnospiraceae bacterium]